MRKKIASTSGREKIPRSEFSCSSDNSCYCDGEFTISFLRLVRQRSCIIFFILFFDIFRIKGGEDRIYEFVLLFWRGIIFLLVLQPCRSCHCFKILFSHLCSLHYTTQKREFARGLILVLLISVIE